MILSTNVLFGVQSVLKKNDSLSGMYYDYAMAAPMMADAMKKDKINLLVLGMGTGTYATQCERYFKKMQIDGVEIDERITDLSKKYFRRDGKKEVITYDGRAYLNAVKKKYDVIMVDAYQDITIPFQMSSVEFFTLVKEHLKQDGVMVVNMNMRGTKEGNINKYLADTISQVFPDVYTVDVEGATNRELFASASGKMIGNMKENLALESDENLTELLKRVENNLKKYESGEYILTDDKAPVELLGMRVIDDLIKNEMKYYKAVLKEKGVKGLLEEFGI